VDVDATIVRTRADKEDAAPTYKRTFGHHPLLAMNVETNEILSMILRPGNAGSNTAIDHVVLLNQVIAALPEAWRPTPTEAHDEVDGDRPAQRVVLVRSDSAGASHWFAEHCRDRGCAFSFGYQVAGAVRDALLLVDEWDWTPAVNGNGQPRPQAWVVELTDLVDLSSWPKGTRLIVRRERPLGSPEESGQSMGYAASAVSNDSLTSAGVLYPMPE
jgi:hypothetical protein